MYFSTFLKILWTCNTKICDSACLLLIQAVIFAETSCANTGRSAKQGTTPIGVYDKGKTSYGVYDMIGNIGEWTASWYKGYKGSHYKVPNFGEKERVIRGSSWGGVGHYKLNAYDRASFRRSAEPATAIPDVGFRCAKTP